MIFKGRVTNSTQEASGTSQSGKPWVRKDFVIEETSGEYPNSIVATNFNNKIEIKEGDVGEFHINSKVNQYNEKYYNSLNLWKFQPEQQTEQQPSSVSRTEAFEASGGQKEDGLPF